jgi:DNA-binding NarL/FixJ family response regulator
MEMIRVLVADNYALFREGMQALLQATPDFTFAGEAATGDEAIVLAAVLQPNIVLIDINMPGTSGIETTCGILRQNSSIGIIMVTMWD